MFAFVSGYGLYLSYQGNRKNVNIWIKSRLVKLLSGYWFIVVSSWIICLVIDGRTISVYFNDKSTWLGIWNMLIEFFGLSNFVGTELLNGSWWYISAAVIFVILTPVLCKTLVSFGNFVAVVGCFIVPRLLGGYFGGVHWASFLLAFVMGMVFAKSDVFNLWENWSIGKNDILSDILKFCILFFLVGLGYKLYYYLPTKQYWDVKYGLIPILIILFAKEYVFSIPILGNILVFLGKHSANIWLIHTFIRYYYCESFIYGLGYWGLIILVLLLISLCISIVVEFLKKVIGYEKLIQKLL